MELVDIRDFLWPLMKSSEGLKKSLGESPWEFDSPCHHQFFCPCGEIAKHYRLKPGCLTACRLEFDHGHQFQNPNSLKSSDFIFLHSSVLPTANFLQYPIGGTGILYCVAQFLIALSDTS